MLKNRIETKVKLIDFGLARVINPGETVREIMGTPEFVGKLILGAVTGTAMFCV